MKKEKDGFMFRPFLYVVRSGFPAPRNAHEATEVNYSLEAVVKGTPTRVAVYKLDSVETMVKKIVCTRKEIMSIKKVRAKKEKKKTTRGKK